MTLSVENAIINATLRIFYREAALFCIDYISLPFIFAIGAKKQGEKRMDEKKNTDYKRLEWSKPKLVELSKAKHVTSGDEFCAPGYGNSLGCYTGPGAK